MASSLALRRLLSANRFPKSLAISTTCPLAITRSPASKLFNTNALSSSDDDNNESDLNFDRRSGPHFSRRGYDFFSDVFVPFSPKPYLSHVLNLMDQISENPVLSATRGVGEAGLRLGWGARETEDALHLRFDMPGLGKEDVKVSVEHNNILSIKGEGGKEDNVGEEEAPPRRYNTGIGLPEKMFKTDSIKAEMKNGVLKVVLPKVKEGLKHTGWSSGCSEGEGRTTSRRCFETQQFKDLNTRDSIVVENEFQIPIPTTRHEIEFLAACEG